MRQIVRLGSTSEAFGGVIDLLSRHDPFRTFSVDQLSSAVRMQLAQRHHVAAMEGGRVVGYLGWILTSKVLAEKWLANQGTIKPVSPAEADAIAVTILVAPDGAALKQLVRQARAGYPDVAVFFKRQSGEKERKTTVTSVNRALSPS